MICENTLSRGTPEEHGIPSEAIAEFLNTLEEKRICLHSFLLMRHGIIVAEGYSPPFSARKKHRMYSVSKSFTSVAVGLMIDEGKLRLTDKVADFFPEYLPENPHPFIVNATVRDLLMMSTYHPNTSYSFSDRDWVKTFFNPRGTVHPPGTVFSYDTSATVVLSAIIEKLSGMPFLDYMRPRLLDRIGVSQDAECIKSPDGRSWSGSGVLCTTRDLARFALLCMNKGKWGSERLVSEEYMIAATSRQIDNFVARDAPEMNNGYGYQFWCLKHGGFACYGMGGQLALCVPKYDTVLITTADTQINSGGIGDISDAYWALLKDAGDKLPENPSEQAELSERISRLRILLPPGKEDSPLAGKYGGVAYDMEDNRMGITRMMFDFSPGKAVMSYTNKTGSHSLTLGFGEYAAQKFPEAYSGMTIGINDRHYDCIAGAAWADEKTMTALIYSVDDYLGTIKMQAVFSEDCISLYMTKAAEHFFEEYHGFAWGREVRS